MTVWRDSACRRGVTDTVPRSGSDGARAPPPGPSTIAAPPLSSKAVISASTSSVDTGTTPIGRPHRVLARLYGPAFATLVDAKKVPASDQFMQLP